MLLKCELACKFIVMILTFIMECDHLPEKKNMYVE